MDQCSPGTTSHQPSILLPTGRGTISPLASHPDLGGRVLTHRRLRSTTLPHLPTGPVHTH